MEARMSGRVRTYIRRGPIYGVACRNYNKFLTYAKKIAFSSDFFCRWSFDHREPKILFTSSGAKGEHNRRANMFCNKI